MVSLRDRMMHLNAHLTASTVWKRLSESVWQEHCRSAIFLCNKSEFLDLTKFQN